MHTVRHVPSPAFGQSIVLGPVRSIQLWEDGHEEMGTEVLPKSGRYREPKLRSRNALDTFREW